MFNGNKCIKSRIGDFPGGPVVRTQCFQCRGRTFDPWSGNKIPHAAWHSQKTKKKKKKKI